MKKIISILLCVIVIFGFIACNGESKSTSDVMAKLPASVKSIGYINVENMMKVDATKELLETFGEDYKDIINNFKEVIIGVSEVKGGMDLSSLDADRIGNYVIILSGKYEEKKIRELVKNEMNLTEEIKIKNFKGLKGKDGSLIFLTDNYIAITSLGFEEEVISAIKEGKNTLGKNSDIYKKAKNMNSSELMWIVSDLSYMGEVKLSDLGLEGIDEKTSFHTLKFAISENNNILNLSLSIDLDSKKVGEKIKTNLETTLKMSYGIFSKTGLLSKLDPELKKELDQIVSNFKINVSNKTISTNIKLKLDMLKKLEQAIPSLMGSALGGGGGFGY